MCNIPQSTFATSIRKHTFETPETYICNIGKGKPGRSIPVVGVGAGGERRRTSTSATSASLGLAPTVGDWVLQHLEQSFHATNMFNYAYKTVVSCYSLQQQQQHILKYLHVY